MSAAQASAQESRAAREEKRRKRKERAASRVPEPKDIVSGAGQPLDPSVRRELEEQLGHDFGRVRLHTDRDSGQLAELMGADAFAVGQDIFFREGTYRPGTADGQRLLAHELLHTVQNPHGLGALRAGRDLGSVSLPQEGIEREAESAAQETVRAAMLGSVRSGAEAEAEVGPGQATPGWLRYATVDADRRRFEQLDPATLVDRLANGVLRSLRGDPEDLSGRARLQLARLAPEVQDSVLDRLEVRLSTPGLERLYALVEELEQAGQLPLDAAAAPAAVPDEAEAIRQERAQQAADARSEREQSEKEGDDRRKRQQRRQDSGPAGGGAAGERGGRAEDGSAAGGTAKAASPQTAAAAPDRSAEQTRDTAGAQQESRAEEKQQDHDAARQRSQQDTAGAAGGRQEDGQDAGRQSAQAAQQEPEGSGDGRADQAAEEKAAGPEELDTSAEEPGEKDRTGRGADVRRGGDPDNDADADDEPLGLEEEPADLDEDAEDAGTEEGDEDAGLEEADAEGDEDAGPEDGPDGATGAAADAKNTENASDSADGGRGGAPGVLKSPADEDQSTAALRQTQSGSGGSGAGDATEESESDDQLSEDLQTDKSLEQEIGPEPDESADDKTGEEPGENGADTTGPDDAEREAERAAERREDAEAKRRDEAARAATAGSGGAGPGPGGDTSAPGKLAKSDEDARRQAVGTAPESSAAGAGGGKGAGGGSAGAGDTGVRAASATGEAAGAEAGAPTGTHTGSAGDKATGSAQHGPASGNSASGGSVSDGSASGDTASHAGGRPKDDPATKDATEGKGVTEAKDTAATQDVSQGKGPATTPSSTAGPDDISAAGFSSPGKPAAGSGPAGLMSAGTSAKGGAPAADGGPKPAARPHLTGPKRQAARQAAKAAASRGGGGGGGRTSPAPAPAPVRGGARGGGGGRGAASGATKPKKEAPAPDVSKGTPESGLATAAGLKPHIALETLKGVDGAVGNSVGKERAALRKAPPKTERPSGSPKTVPGGPKAAAPGTYTNAKVSRTDAPQGKTPEIDGEQRPTGQPPTADMPEPSWWDIGVTIGAKLLGKVLKKLLPLDDLIDSILELPSTDEGMRGTRVGDAPGLPLQDDSDPHRTDEQGQKLDERKNELHRSGREDAARPMGEDQIYPDVPRETLTGKVPGGTGKKAGKAGGRKAPSGGVPVESVDAVAEHDRGPQIQAGFTSGRQKMTDERRAKDRKAKDDKQKHDRDLKREVDASSKTQANEREKGQSEISDHRDKWRKEQDDKVSEIDGKKGKRYEEVRGKIKKREKETDDHVEERTKKDNEQIDKHQTGAQEKAEQKKKDSKDNADNWLDGAINELKSWFKEIKHAIKTFFEEARNAITGLIDRFKDEVFKFIDKARNWVVDRINEFADGLIALGDELLADYPAMRDKWRNTINGARNYAVRKVNEAAGALKKVVGGLLDGLSDALVAGLNVLEDGLMQAVDVAEGATVGALEFAKGVIEALGEWAAIFNDIVSDPGGWISKAGDAARTGAREYLFEETKSAVKRWVNEKIQEITGLSPEDFQALIEGDVSAEEMGKMAWDAALPQLPVIIGELVIKQVVAKLIPGAGWAMAIIDALKTAWGALSKILAAFGLFMDFLKAVKSGNAARPFAKAVAAGVVALLELVYQALVHGIQKYMGKVTSKLGEMLKNIRSKRRPGGHDGPNEPGRPGHHDKPGQDDRPANANRPGPTADKPGPTDKPNQRPVPRKPSPDKTSRPDDGPRPAKRPSPEKKPRPEHQPKPKHKKKPDEHERREDGHEVNAARRRARAAQRAQHDDKPDLNKRRGPARDTLRKKNRPADKRDDGHKTKDPLHKKTQDDKGHRKPDLTKHKDGKKKVSTRKHPRRKPESRTRRRLRRARQTLKSALNRARRAARRLFGKGRKLGHKLNNRTHRLRNQWRRHRDRLRRRHERRRNRPRDRQREPDGKKDYDLPKVRFRTKAGEMHTLLFNGRGRSADLAVRSQIDPLQTYFNEWEDDNKKLKDSNPDMYAEQEKLRKEAKRRGDATDAIQDRLPEKETTNPKTRKPLGSPIFLGSSTDANFDGQMANLQRNMERLAELLAQRFSEADKPPLPPTILPPFSDGTTARSFKASYIKKTTPAGSEAEDRPDAWPLGWDKIVHRNLAKHAAWVRMHMLTGVLGGESSTSNLVPARGSTNIDAREKVEHPAARSLDKRPGGRGWSGAGEPNEMIWYDVDITYRQDYPGFPSSVVMTWGGYHHPNGQWQRTSAGGKRSGSWNTGNFDKPPWDSNEAPHAIVNINTTSNFKEIEAATRVKPGPARTIISKRNQEPDKKFSGMNELRDSLLRGVKSDRLRASRERVIGLLEIAEASGRLIFR